jgi:acyl-CoA thioesterase-2
MGANREGQLVGDRPSILDLLDLEFIEENLYRSCVIVEGPRARLFGGQVAAQALYVAGKTVPDGRLPHSLHGYFLRAGSPLRPTLFQVERDRDGHSFSARRVVAIQNGEVIFNMAASFTAPGSGPDLDADPILDTPAPETLSVWSGHDHDSFEFRTAQTAEHGFRIPTEFWMRCTAGLPDDPLLHAAVLTYTSDISSGLITLEGGEGHGGPSLDHAVWFHRPVRMDEWNWQGLIPHTAAAGRGLYTGVVYSAAGSRLATIAQETLFRKPRQP